MSAIPECGTNEQGAVPGRGVCDGRTPRFRCDTHHPTAQQGRTSRLSRDLLRGHVRELPDLSVLHEGMEGLVALSNKYISWPMTTIKRWRDRVQIGERVRYSNPDADEINIVCTVVRKLPHLVVVEPVNKGHISRTRTMRYTEVYSARV